ncbi:hypothetical protein GQ457_06G002530 [Hibiscus cannabinus]
MAEEAGAGSGGGSSSDRGGGGGGEIRRGVGSALVDSLESRWVFPGEDESEIEDDDEDEEDIEDDVPYGAGVDSEDEDSPVHRLIRTERTLIPSTSKLSKSMARIEVTTSVMFSKAPINGDEDVIGALSLVLYTLLLFPLVKYVLIVLWANDDGEGGTFALYSLICRHAKVSLLPNQVPSDARISGFTLKVPSPELERSLKIKETLETSLTLKKLLLMLVLVGTSMVIADGVVTPAMSDDNFAILFIVMSAVGGLKVGVGAIEQDEVVMISVAFLVILFSVQKFGTSQVGLAVGPALFIWFCSLAGIGIYNLVKHDASVLRAFNPVHIYLYFKRNSVNAWYALGGCLLCATGSEAMFADLCYFSVRSIQLTFVFLVLPSLMLGYLGQAAYLIGNHNGVEHAFFSSIPSGVFWPVLLIANIAALIASRAMTTATFSCIKQSSALGCFPRLKIIHTSKKFMGQIYIPVIKLVLAGSLPDLDKHHNCAELFDLLPGFGTDLFSSVLWSVPDGSWIILVFAVIMFVIMWIWNYGSKLKYETEVTRKLPMDLMRELGSNLGTIRAPGIGLLYNELAKGVPAIFGQFITTLPAIHSMIILSALSMSLFLWCLRMKDSISGDSAPEVTISSGVLPAQERQLESDGDEDAESEQDTSFSRVVVTPNGSVYSLGVPLLAEYVGCNNSISEVSTSEEIKPDSATDSSASDAEHSLERELSFIRKAKESGVVYLLGHGDIRARKDSWFIKKLVINYFYAFLRKNCRRSTANLSVPHSHLIQVGMTYMVLRRLRHCTCHGDWV